MKTFAYCPWCGKELVNREVDGIDRKVCPDSTCGFVSWDNPVPVVTALVEHEGRVVLARNKTWPEKMYGLITGFLEKDESPEEGVLREVMEELGVHGVVKGFLGLFPFPQMNQLLIAYNVEVEGELVPGEELAELKYVPPEKLKPWDFGTGLVVKKWLAL